MKKRYILTLIIFLLLGQTTFAQHFGAWKRTRYELIGGAGVSEFMGDLGGGNHTSSNNYFGDLNLESTRLSLMLGMRYKLSPSFALKAGFTYGWISADDKNSDDISRKNRNLNFHSPLFEQCLNIEYYIIKEKMSGRWSRHRKKKMSKFSPSLYIYTGIGGFYFNPKAEMNGKTYKLHDLNTNEESYSRYSFCIPSGIGLNFSINKKLSIGLDFGYRVTFTDYIDNVGSNYISNESILDNNGHDRNIGLIADNHKVDIDIDESILIDPQSGVIKKKYFTAYELEQIKAEDAQHPYLVYEPGDRKPFGTGDHDNGSKGYKCGEKNDNYMFLFVNVSYKLQTNRNGLPKFKF